MKFVWCQIIVPLVIGIAGSLVASRIYADYQENARRVLVHKALLAELRGNLQSVGMSHFSPFLDGPHPAICEIRKDVFTAAMADPLLRPLAAAEEPGHDYLPAIYHTLDDFAEEGKKPLTNEQFSELHSRCCKEIKQWLTTESVNDADAGLWFHLRS